MREGIREFLRFPSSDFRGDPLQFPIMGDCGAFSYAGEAYPPYSPESMADFYEMFGFTHGVSPDHIVLEFSRKWDRGRRRPDAAVARAELTFRNALRLLEVCEERGCQFVPIGALQCWSPNSAKEYAKRLVSAGYTYIGLGGLANRPTRDIRDVVCEIRSAIPASVGLHVFGFNRVDRLEDFAGLGITSFDSSSPLIKAFRDGRHNYFAPSGNHYVALKITHLDEARIKRRIQSGQVEQGRGAALERRCLLAVRDYAARRCKLPHVLESLLEYERWHAPGRDCRQDYQTTLAARPWESCGCRICQAIGVEVILFRGLNRNKRRGFHNLHVFYEKLKRVRAMTALEVPCIRIQQNPNKVIYSFAVNGKDIPRFAAVSRVRRDRDGELVGYQRPEILEHINDIRGYLEKQTAILPNSIVVAFDQKLEYCEDRQFDETSGVGRLRLRIGKEHRSGWIVDGQQRVAALRSLKRDSLPVSVIGFESESVEDERSQFILVNNTRPLPTSLVYELLPSIRDAVPPKLRKRQRASRILEQLNHDPTSPFYQRVRTVTSKSLPSANIKDTSVLRMIENSIDNGILLRFQQRDRRILTLLNNYWGAVKDYYGEAWELGPRASRLTHGVGIVSMGYIMDAMGYKLASRWAIPPNTAFLAEMDMLGGGIAWTAGVWRFSDDLVMPWNELQNTSRHIDLVANYLIRRYRHRKSY